MFNNLLARVGIGAATVNTEVDEAELMPGDTLRGDILLRGGATAQEVDGVTLALVTDVRHNDIYERAVLAEQHLDHQFTLQPGEARRLPFSMRLPLTTPLSIGRQQIILRTSLNISGGLDPHDGDPLRVLPHPLMVPVLQGLDQLGFELHYVECDRNRRLDGEQPIIQTLEYQPGGEFEQIVEELEVIFRLDQDGLEVWLEVDRRMGALTGLLDDLELNERHTRFRVTDADLEQRDWGAFLAETIESAAHN